MKELMGAWWNSTPMESKIISKHSSHYSRGARRLRVAASCRQEAEGLWGDMMKNGEEAALMVRSRRTISAYFWTLYILAYKKTIANALQIVTLGFSTRALCKCITIPKKHFI